MAFLKRPARAALAVLLLPWAAGCNRLFFYPSREPLSDLDGLGVPLERVAFASADGTRLSGVFFPAATRPAKGAVLHFHGNAENLTSHFPFAYWLTKEGYDLLVFDYRGYGASAGKPSVKGAVQDGVAALRFLRAKPGVDPRRLVVFGQSLGGAVALTALAEDGGEGVRAVVLESAFSSYRAMARDRLGRLFLTWPLQVPLSWLFSDRYSPARAAARRPPCPLLVIHGDADPVVPLAQSRALLAASPEPKELWVVPGGKHLEAFTRLRAEYRPRLAAFLARALADRP